MVTSDEILICLSLNCVGPCEHTESLKLEQKTFNCGQPRETSPVRAAQETYRAMHDAQTEVTRQIHRALRHIH